MRRLSLAVPVLIFLVAAVLLYQREVAGVTRGRTGPGREVTDLSALDPAFRVCFEALLKDLRASGWRPVVIATWRDQERQAFYRDSGASQTMYSHHGHTTPEGRPAARAADVARDAPLWMIPMQASFYQALRRAAPRHGLVTGGTWARSRWVWKRYDLGWDPGHVEAQPGQCGVVLLSAMAAGDALAQPRPPPGPSCPEGQVAVSGHCCWPGQSFARERGACQGAPAECPPGTRAQGDACAPVAPRLPPGHPGRRPTWMEEVNDIIRTGSPALRDCYNRSLQRDPQLSGLVHLRFTIAPQGRVSRAEARGADATTARCLTTVMKRWRFPPPPGGREVEISAPR